MAEWETGEGNIVQAGRVLLRSDQIVIHRTAARSRGALQVFVPCVRIPERLRRRSAATVRLEDGRSGDFVVVETRPGLLCLAGRGAFR
ncbi:hypothetical protein QWY84_08785 [Aquisalimonas lutea]|uniref:hypothetical protein n=1 Tax=Aquisalimonas lutea TaxID=1327750 RepID=UPI0025B4D3C4|nr:hypothetical protein [Aquisalimonas lutea]MDN3517702.1 hypothetical protein [Aquisalimonas lutea]